MILGPLCRLVGLVVGSWFSAGSSLFLLEFSVVVIWVICFCVELVVLSCRCQSIWEVFWVQFMSNGVRSCVSFFSLLRRRGFSSLKPRCCPVNFLLVVSLLFVVFVVLSVGEVFYRLYISPCNPLCRDLFENIGHIFSWEGIVRCWGNVCKIGIVLGNVRFSCRNYM